MAGCSWHIGFVDLETGLLGEVQAEVLIDALCAEGCPHCHGALIREGRYKCYCPKWHMGLELAPSDGDQDWV